MPSNPEPTQVSSAELAAQRARRGYAYQDHVAVSFFLKLLCDENLRAVECETVDDIVLTWREGTEVFTEYVQVKSDNHDQFWSVSLLCKQETDQSQPAGHRTRRRGTSILEKNASRDGGEHRARFRVVTRVDANKELAVLKRPLREREIDSNSQLIDKIADQFGEVTILDREDLDYWVRSAVWDTRGSEHALHNANRLGLIGAVELICGRSLSVADTDRLYRELATQATEMALGQGTLGADQHSLTDEEMRIWLCGIVESIPQFAEPDQLTELRRVERLSIGRCETLWLSLGLELAEAEALASQPSIGARPDFFFTLSAGFHWVIGDFGAGKSLAVERSFQQQVAEFEAGARAGIPVFLRAPELQGTSVEEAARLAAQRLGRVDQRGIFLIIDALDEAGVQRARELLRQAFELSRGWELATVIVTSAPLPFDNAFSEFRHDLPPLADREAEEIVTRFAGYDVPYWHARSSLGDDVRLPLFAVLLGMRLRTSDQVPASRGELLEEVVRRALKERARDLSVATDRLCELAAASTDQGGAPVPVNRLRWALAELSPLFQTRLVAELGRSVHFPVASIRLWFAAESLAKGIVQPEGFAQDRPRLFAWKDALAMFLATQGFEVASRLMDGLAMKQPALAAHLVAAAFRGNQARVIREPLSAEDFGRQTRRCLNAWLQGLDPLSPAFEITDPSGKLLPMQAAADGRMLWIRWIGDPTAPELTVVNQVKLPEFLASARRVYGYAEQDQEAHVWRSSRDVVAYEIKKVVQQMEARPAIVDEVFQHEDTWNATVGLVRKRVGWFDAMLSWEEIEPHRRTLQVLGHWAFLESMHALHSTGFPAPHPPGDSMTKGACWIPAFYSPEAALAHQRSVLGAALGAYQRIVRRFFPHLVHDLSYSAWWPNKLVGVLSSNSREGGRTDYVVSYYLEPVEEESQATVELAQRSDQDFLQSLDWEALQAKISTLRPNCDTNFWMTGTVANLHDTHPSTKLVFEWLKKDLAEAGWGSDANSRTF